MVTRCWAYLCYRHPRTAIGVDDAGRVLLVVVDGRRRTSVGMDLVQLANLMRRLGAVSALNLDGGGSSTMVVRGKVKNRPSDETVRRGGFTREGIELRRESGASAFYDPGSTGGLLDAVDRGLFGARGLPPELRSLLRVIRSSGWREAATSRARSTTPG